MAADLFAHARKLIEGAVETSPGVVLDRIETPQDNAPDSIIIIILSLGDTQRTIELPTALVEENKGDDEMLLDWLLNQIEKVKNI